MCLAFEPGTAEWKAQTNPLSYVGPLFEFEVKYQSQFFQFCVATYLVNSSLTAASYNKKW